jgi:hypothetical protein
MAGAGDTGWKEHPALLDQRVPFEKSCQVTRIGKKVFLGGFHTFL